MKAGKLYFGLIFIASLNLFSAYFYSVYAGQVFGKEVSENLESGLHNLIREGDVKNLEEYLSRDNARSLINVRDENGNAALHLALIMMDRSQQDILERIKIIEVLLNAGADSNIENDSGYSVFKLLEKIIERMLGSGKGDELISNEILFKLSNILRLSGGRLEPEGPSVDNGTLVEDLSLAMREQLVGEDLESDFVTDENRGPRNTTLPPEQAEIDEFVAQVPFDQILLLEGYRAQRRASI